MTALGNWFAIRRLTKCKSWMWAPSARRISLPIRPDNAVAVPAPLPDVHAGTPACGPAAISWALKGGICISSSGCLRACGIVPTAIRGDDRVRILRSPTTALVGASPMVRLKDRLDHSPGGLDRVLTGE